MDEAEKVIAARSMMRAGKADAEIEKATGIEPVQLLELRASAASAPMGIDRFVDALPCRHR